MPLNKAFKKVIHHRTNTNEPRRAVSKRGRLSASGKGVARPDLALSPVRPPFVECNEGFAAKPFALIVNDAIRKITARFQTCKPRLYRGTVTHYISNVSFSLFKLQRT